MTAYRQRAIHETVVDRARLYAATLRPEGATHARLELPAMRSRRRWRLRWRWLVIAGVLAGACAFALAGKR